MGKISGHIFMQILESTIATLVNHTCKSFIKLTPVIYSFLSNFFHYLLNNHKTITVIFKFTEII